MRMFLLALLGALPALAWAQPTAAPSPGASRPARAAPAAAPSTAARPARTAREPSAAQLAQRQRMRDCSAEARNRGLSGALRTAFIRPCLGGNPPTAGSAG